MNRPPMLTIDTVRQGTPMVRDISGTWQQFMGITPGEANAVAEGLAAYGRIPADEAWVYRCVSLKATFAQGVPLRVYVRDGKTLIPAADATNAAAQDLQALLDDVNPVSMNGADLKAFSVAALSVWGETYWRKVRGRLGGPPKELWWLRSPDVTPKLGSSWIEAYEYRPTGNAGATAEVYAARDVVAFRRLNLQDPTRGLSPLSATRYDIALSRQASEATNALVANWSIPPGAWVIPKDAEFTPQDRSLVQRVLRSLRGPRNRGKVPVLPAGLTWQAMALSPQDAEWLAARKVSRMTVCAALGVPLVLAGDDEKTGVYRSMLDAERIFARNMIGELDWIADGINGWLVPDFDPAPPAQRAIVVGFDYAGIEALQAPLEDRKRVAILEVQNGIRARDEYRAEFALGPALPDGVPQFVQLTTLLPVDAPAPEVPEPDLTAEEVEPAALRALYRQPAVKAYLAGGPLEPVAALLGVEPSAALAEGLRRRYTASQLLDGFPAEGFAGLKPTTQGVTP